MEINRKKLKNSLINLKHKLKCEDKLLNNFLRLEKFTEKDVEVIYKYLNEKLLDFEYTENIGLCFRGTLLLIVSSVIRIFNDISDEFEVHQRKCIVLSKLIKYSPDIIKYSTKYFANQPAPFKIIEPYLNPQKKTKLVEPRVTNLEIIKCCYNLLASNPNFFKDIWNWSVFLELYLKKGSTMEQLYCNHVAGILTNMTQYQVKQLNSDISEEEQIKFDQDNNRIEFIENPVETINNNDETIIWNFNNDVVINVEGVLLPIYNYDNSTFYENTDGNYDRIVKVESTQINLRSIALGVASGKAICLSGPVGCGKTTLVEYLARKTGRICPKNIEIENFSEPKIEKKTPLEDTKNKKNINVNATKRKNDADENYLSDINAQNIDGGNQENGFLRIQLGDQTDSKMLLGQYRCTDVPGEFIWLPGVLTQAVINGYWLLLEDLDSATQDTFTILSNLLENNSLSVPGFRDCVKIEPGFQLFVTTRTNKLGNNTQKSLISLLEKYLYTINILPLSRNELCHIIGINYPKLKTIANRIVDVYLTFSSGDHSLKNLSILQNEDSNIINSETENYIALPFEKISISNLTNYGRLVSTRDLIKLCQRSNPMFSVTSTECAYFVFQNAVDVFCSYLPCGPEKTKLISSIGAKIGIIQSRCEFFANEYKPEILIEHDRIKIGRSELKPKSEVELKRRQLDDGILHGSKKVKLNENTEKTIYLPQEKNECMVTFSFTRMVACLLERIAVCIEQNEPILLVGETGVGKTSSVQYLAQKTNHKLIVVNMNNQSDVSDLVGGFKPVDLSYVMAPLRYEFEQLFRKTFNENKNEEFLNNIGVCYNQGKFQILIKLMIKITDAVFDHASKNTFTIKNQQDYLKKWRLLQTKILKLNSQLQKSINISFAFITGSLVNCIKNGNWVLLDEINLASAETLECLSTILEPDGSIVLLEKGDFIPIKRHPNFRILACMNPNTDIGKKDLPVGIRNRFTEFFVDELTTENDLMLLVNDYLNNTGIKKTKVLNIVKLYKKLKLLSNLELNDGLGNRPVFSLRTLCRSLMICGKNLCGSVERNLYESFCLSFLTQLDPMSHKIVLNLIKEAMLSNAKAILSQPIPQPGENFINFEGYWIEKGPKEINECENYILTESVKQNLKDLSRIISIGKLPILLQGPTSAGKTSLIQYVAKKSGNHCLRINNHEHTDLQEYIGTYTSDVSGKLTFKEGVLVQAMRNGFWIILDELNLASTDILEALNRVLDDNRELFIPETQTVVKAHKNFMLFATQNPPGLYGGRKTLSRAFKNRFIELHFAEIPKPELEIILEKRCLIPKSYSQKMVKCMAELQANRKTTTKNNFTLRDLFRWGNRYTYADKKLLADNSYDWNQHLVDEGYLVLSAKVRTDIEVEIIEESLYKNFRKKINTENLYSLNGNVSMVTKDILVLLHNYTNRCAIIWTQNMTRMAVLTAKALQFNEPILLVGPTGCGKTTICQILANIKGKNLRILNCHMHTEGADFLGGLRPCRTIEENVAVDSKHRKSKKQLFEWADGPLVMSMQEGSYFMADEISLAEDSVLERLNSILEPERTVLLAEKGGVSSNVNAETLTKIAKDFIVEARDDFSFLATMNPGGDFGKKELSPALRNRFTEIWCKPSDDKKDLIEITETFLHNNDIDGSRDKQRLIANVIINIVFYLKEKIEKFIFSVRDILAFSNYLLQNSKNINLNLAEAIIFGLETVFLDSLEMLPHESIESITNLRIDIIKFAIAQIENILGVSADETELENKRGNCVEYVNNFFGIKPFYIEINTNIEICQNNNFLFEAPTTKNNLFRLLSALSLKKAILLEGPPGVGKTSIVENLAQAIGYKIVRINLCEHTDLADLFGTDLPAEEKSLELNLKSNLNVVNNQDETTNLGTFVWRDGPLLAALKSENTWILLDELNLAPQTVLEGLNAILDHRGEVFIPELNKVFTLGQQTRIFACQNPLRQGGGRKGLPQSFLNRFTKVYLRKLNRKDLLYVINGRYSKFFQQVGEHFNEYFHYIEMMNNSDSDENNLFDVMNKIDQFTVRTDKHQPDIKFNIAEKMVHFSEILDQGITNLEFGYKGGPFEINLRDILRWCDLLINEKTGFIMKQPYLENNKILKNLTKDFNNFLLILYERMKLIYYHRMRSEQDRNFICNSFGVTFNCDANKLNNLSEDISFYWTDSAIYLNDIVLERNSTDDMIKNENYLISFKNLNTSPLLLDSQRELLKNLTECVHMKKPVILCGPTDSGKTKAINTLCTISNQICNLDTIDDSVTGSFQQIDLNRHLEEISENVESILIGSLHHLLLNQPNQISEIVKIFNSWNSYINLLKFKSDNYNCTALSDELILFRKRIDYLGDVIETLLNIKSNYDNLETRNILEALKNVVLKRLTNVIKNSDSLNTGGHFEWVDSKIVKSLKSGQYICLEHVNLCSSAVLDRLNPIFEPNGSLLISEKGITAGDEAELVQKHKNFRAFLTLDSKNGELSRAMRNRCIEISLTKDVYTNDDLKKIIYMNGIYKMHLIKSILKIHCEIRNVTDMNNFNISHLIRFAFLVSSYTRIGYSDEKAIFVSGLEVYVHSSNTDLLGYGLAFYQNKLKDIIVENSKTLLNISTEIYNYKNIIITCDNLNSMSLVKLQCEPLVILLNNLNNTEDTKENVSNLFENLKYLHFETNFQFIKYYLYLIYESSTFEDVSFRYKHLVELLDTSNKLIQREKIDLLLLNSNLFNNIREYKILLKNYADNLPWNSKLFPRIREYQKNSDINSDMANQLSALLLNDLLIETIADEKVCKLSKMSAIAYSQAINCKSIGDSANNVLLQYLSTFLKSLQLTIRSTLVKSSNLDINIYIELIISYLWLNRLYDCSKINILFLDKTLNSNIMDKLLLHFKWIDKNLLKILENLFPNYKQLNTDFDLSLQKIRNYSMSISHPLNLLRKLYYKKNINFDPFYSDEQVHFHELRNEFENLINLVPDFGSFEYSNIIKKYLYIYSDSAEKFKSIIMNSNLTVIELLKKIRKISGTIITELPNGVSQNMKNAIKEFNKSQLQNESIEVQIDFETMERVLSCKDLFAMDELKTLPNFIEIEILSLREYFLLKYLSQSNFNSCHKLNPEYYENIPSLKCNDLELIQIIISEEFKNFNKMWFTFMNYIVTLDSLDKFEESIKCFTCLDYRNFTTFYRNILKYIQIYQLSSLANRPDCCLELSFKKHDINSEMQYNGPPLTNIILSILFKSDGKLRSIPLSDLNLWKKTLNNMRQLLWNNSNFTSTKFNVTKTNLNVALLYSQKLIYEIEYIQKLCQNMENQNFSDYNENFGKLVNKLKIIRKEAETNLNNNYKKHQIYSAFLHSVIGSIELCVLTFTPLIDPVEKNGLKNKYIIEDINCLTTLTNIYDFMKIIMKYNNFGSEIYSEIEKKICKLEKKNEKYSQKVALRSEKCLYGNLVQDINHFLNTNCKPQSLLSLILKIEELLIENINLNTISFYLPKISECIKMIEVWIANSKRFIHHSLKKYSNFYRDFLQPIECSVVMTRFGLEELKSSLVQLQNSLLTNQNGFYEDLKENNKLVNILENIIQFPCTTDLKLFESGKAKKLLKSKSRIFTILDKVGDSEILYFALLKAKIIELKNRTIISSDIDNNIFYELDTVLNISNQIWQEEEERRRIRIAEEESLYINKIRCKQDNEEEIELLEIHDNFPTYVEQDFGEFVVEDSLEKIIKLSNVTGKKIINVIENDDFKLLGETFMFIMEHFARNYYYHPDPAQSQIRDLDFVAPFKDRIQVFVKIFNHYKQGMNDLIDENIYNSFGFAIGLQQNLLNEIAINKNSEKTYNFYKDSNIPEIILCAEILDEIEIRVEEQINLYPEHATLNDIIRVIVKIRSLPAISPVVRFNTGFQILRQKLSLWNDVAHKNNHMRDLETRVAEFVQHWTKLELQFWRNCLSQTSEKVESNAYKYWFFIYNLLHEYLEANEVDLSLADFTNTEKRFEEGTFEKDTEGKTFEIRSADIIRVLTQFIESSNYGDFEIRMKLLKTFELYLYYIPHHNEIRKDILIAIFHNLKIYYQQFAIEIEATKKFIRTPIEKKLREFVKIESYNKDLSYFSMRNNVARVHRTLNKFLKEYELQLKNKITPVFQQKNDNLSKELNLDNEKGGKNLRYETKIKYYMIDVKNFLASVKLKNQFILVTNQNYNIGNILLLNKLDKLFITSRNICKQVILHAEYPSIIYSLDLLLTDQIETCEYLKNLDVDRSQERPKQVTQAKNILQQKRKSLSDLFKSLSTLGINYKTGLMELSLNMEFVDYKIPPFCIKNMFRTDKYKKLDQNLIYLSENLDTYFAKCILKLKLMKNVMLTPQSELGPPNIDRIKGFSIDMFLLIQNQRKLLSKSLKEVFDLRYIVVDITTLFNCAQTNNLSNDKMNFLLLEEQIICLEMSFLKIQYVFEQLKLLLKCIPDTENPSSTIIENNNFVLVQNSDKYLQVMEICNKILEISKKSSKELIKFKQNEFLNYIKISEFLQIKKNIIFEISKLRKLFELDDNEYLPIAKSLTNLLNYLDEVEIKKTPVEVNNDLTNIENIHIELENIVHSILLAMQKLYKKYSQKETNKSDKKTESPNKKHEPIVDKLILEDHLKQKLFKELTLDMKTLNIENILGKLSNIILSIKYTQNLENKNNYICAIVGILPILEQFSLISDYYVFQQLGAHKVSSKMLSVMLTVFIELLTKGFCVPADLMQDEEGEKKKEEQKGGEGFGLEDGTGEKDASDKIEDEDQLDDAKKPEDRKKESEEKNDNCKEEKGIDMSEDFDANLQDIEKLDNDSDDNNEKSDDEDDLEKQMGDTEQGAEKLDDQIWGSDEEKEESDNDDEMSEEEVGKGNNDENDQHNKLDTKNEIQQQDDGKNNEDGLDATNDQNSEKEKKKQEKDIDDMKEPEIDEDQINPYHNELEEPPDAEDMDLGDNFNLDEENAKDNDNEDCENPFDIDAMKENMEIQENDEENGDKEKNDNQNNEDSYDSDSESEPEAGTKDDKEDEIKEKLADEDNEKKNQSDDETEEKKEESGEQTRGEIDPENPENEDPETKEHEEKNEKFEESKDKPSKEENIQSIPEEKCQGSNDEVQNDEKDAQQEQDLDAQDTGEDKDGIGLAENDTADHGHQGIADTKETKANEDRPENETKNKQKQGRTNEERTLGDPEKNKLKQLKTIEKLKEQLQSNEDDALDENDGKNIDAEEYQHVKEATKTDSTTIDNATDEQSKQIQHLEDEKDVEENANNDNLMEIEDTEDIEENLEEISDMKPEKNDQKSEISSKSEKSKEKCETLEKMEIEGDLVETMKVQRGDATTAHCIKDILLDTSISEELTTVETLELRRMYQNEILKNKIVRPDHEFYEFWQTISNKMLSNARELCEQLRLILEPTKCTRLKGDYRTGRRLNMKKIIPYIASQFRKDKIWLRRTKPAQRDYKITIAIDDSKSMHHNNSKNLTLEAISLVSQALTLLESGKLSILSFGETPQIILNHTEHFDGPKLVNSLNFDQNQSRIAELLDFIRTANLEEGNSSSDNGIFENLLLVLSDGRNIYSEGEQKVKNAIKLARLQRIFLVYIIIDNPENKHSILDIRVPNFSSDRKSISMKSYLDMFPFPYYVIVRDLSQLPIVLSEAMRQWFELVNSDQ